MKYKEILIFIEIPIDRTVNLQVDMFLYIMYSDEFIL